MAAEVKQWSPEKRIIKCRKCNSDATYIGGNRYDAVYKCTKCKILMFEDI